MLSKMETNYILGFITMKGLEGNEEEELIEDYKEVIDEFKDNFGESVFDEHEDMSRVIVYLKEKRRYLGMRMRCAVKEKSMEKSNIMNKIELVNSIMMHLHILNF
jgi:hypothetical protein